MSEDQPKETYYALNVALKTLSERCEQMQSRIKVLEDENLELRTKALDVNSTTTDSLISDSIHSLQTEILQLREKNYELTQQKHQLSVHVEIVAAENRQLWSRLSSLTKSNNNNNSEQLIKEPPMSPNSHQNLIRSKTFTQNNPNPKLREKFKQNEDPEDLLVDVATFAMTENNAGGEDDDVSADEFKKLAEGLLELKQEMTRQNSVLNATRDTLKERNVVMVCKSCAAAKNRNAATSPSDVKMSEMSSEKTQNLGESSKNGPDFVDIVLNTTQNIDFIETKKKADLLNKNSHICPMCGRIYNKETVTFIEFMEHVETHFLLGEDEEEELDSFNLAEDDEHRYESNLLHQF